MFDHVPNNYKSYEGYQTSWRDIQLMDGDDGKDTRTTISMIDALAATGMWDENGDLISPDDADLFREYDLDLKGKDRRHSFWYRDHTGASRPCRLFGHILEPNFKLSSIQNLAQTAVQSSPSVYSNYNTNSIRDAIDTLQRAIHDMGNVSDPEKLQEWLLLVINCNAGAANRLEKHDGKRGIPPTNPDMLEWGANKHGSLNLPTVAAYTGPGGGARFNSVRGYFSLPPGFFSGSGLKTIADAVRTTSDATAFEAAYALNYASCKAVAESVRVIEMLVPTLQRIFPGSIFVSDNYVGSSNHRPDAFCAFVDNVLAQGRVPLFLRVPSVTAARLPADRGVVPNDMTVAAEAALDSITNISTQATSALQDRFLGHITTKRNLQLRRANAGGARLIGAELATDDSAESAVFETPIANLPAFARASLTPDENYLTDAVDGFTYYYDAPVAAIPVYKQLVRLILNYRPAVANITRASVENLLKAELSRAVVLSLLALVNDAVPAGGDAAQTLARRFARIIELLQRAGLPSLTDDTLLTPPAAGSAAFQLNLATLKDAISAFFESREADAKETFGSTRATGGRAAVQRSAPMLRELVDSIAQRAARASEDLQRRLESLAAGNIDIAAGGAGVPHYSADDYRRCDLRVSPEMFSAIWKYVNNNNGEQRVSAALPADPDDVDEIVTQARMSAVAEAIAAGDAVPGSMAPTHLSENKLGHSLVSNLPAVTNVRLLKSKGLLSTSVNAPKGAPANLEASLRRAENYGVSDPGRLVRYEDSMDTNGGGGGASGFHLPDSERAQIRRPDYYRPQERRTTSSSFPALNALNPNLDTEISLSNNFQMLWDMLDGLASSDPTLAAVGKVYLGTPTKWANWEALARNHVILPITIMLARALTVFEVYDMFFMQAGRETMITRFGQPLVSITSSLIFFFTFVAISSISSCRCCETRFP
jgi:hypothetical protein